MVLQLGLGVRQIPGKSYNNFPQQNHVFSLRSLVVSELPFHRVSLGLKCQKLTYGALDLYPEGISCVLIFAHLQQKSLGPVDSLCDWHTFELLLLSFPEPQTRTQAQRSSGELSHAPWVVVRGSASPASGSNRAAFLDLFAQVPVSLDCTCSYIISADCCYTPILQTFGNVSGSPSEEEVKARLTLLTGTGYFLPPSSLHGAQHKARHKGGDYSGAEITSKQKL